MMLGWDVTRNFPFHFVNAILYFDRNFHILMMKVIYLFIFFNLNRINNLAVNLTWNENTCMVKYTDS